MRFGSEQITVTVNRRDLLDKIKANRVRHRQVFLAAQEGFRAQAIALLDANLKAAREGMPFKTALGLVVPTDHTDDYDLTIEMFEAHVDDTVTIAAEDYNKFVRDRWEWKRGFLDITANYTRLAEEDPMFTPAPRSGIVLPDAV